MCVYTFYYDRFSLLSGNNCPSNCLLLNRERLLKNDPEDRFSWVVNETGQTFLFSDNSVDKLLKILHILLKCHSSINKFFASKYY